MSSSEKPAVHVDAFRRVLREEGKEALFPAKAVEKYPHIIDRIYQVWNEPEVASKYFSELLTTQRENRAGFPMEIYSELFALESYYNLSRPKAQKNDDFWSGVNQRD
jgi:hypothetical protein